ncbi:Probable protein phosphatase 2C 76 [Linum perenne]
MVVGRSCLRSLVVQAVLISQTRLLTSNIARRSCSSPIVGRRLNNNTWSSSFFSARTNMMVDSESAAAAAAKGGTAVGGLQPEKEEGGGYVSGGRKSDDGKLSCGYSSFRGKRATMEDFYDIKTTKINEKPVCMFGIFDGHGGSRASEYLKQHLFDNLMKHPQFMTDTKAAISATYQQTDADFLDSEKDTYRDDGSTASTAVLVGDHLYVANVGDSRTVVSKAGKAIALSEDHKPNRSDERKRIEGAGGVVMWAGTWRVGGVLAMSRAFGNRMLKQYVVAEPEIQVILPTQKVKLGFLQFIHWILGKIIAFSLVDQYSTVVFGLM